jgi:hypothetical protein
MKRSHIPSQRSVDPIKGETMKSRSAGDRSPATDTPRDQRAHSLAEHDPAAESLVRHVSTKLATDDVREVVSLLSKALDLAKAELREARKSGNEAHHRLDPSYWIG